MFLISTNRAQIWMDFNGNFVFVWKRKVLLHLFSYKIFFFPFQNFLSQFV